MPVKAFAQAKVRLAPALPPGPRAELARSMAAAVLRAAGALRVAVVCDDDEVRAWAVEQGAQVVWAPGRRLDGAVADGVDALAVQGARRVIVAHADLPLAADLAWVGRFAGVTLVPDRRDDGTNVICVPAGPAQPPFPFSYGPRSFARHGAAAVSLGLPLRVVRHPSLGWDVDEPADLEVAGLGIAMATGAPA